MADEVVWCGWWPPKWTEETRHFGTVHIRRAVVSLAVGKLYCVEDWTKAQNSKGFHKDYSGQYRIYPMHTAPSVARDTILDTLLEVRCFLQDEATNE